MSLSPELRAQLAREEARKGASGQCRSCGAEIVWARLKGKPHPFDSVADNRPPPKGGRFVLFLRAGEATASEVSASPSRMAGWDRYTSHFATCPNADEHRRKR